MLVPQLRARRLLYALAASLLLVAVAYAAGRLYAFVNLFGVFRPHAGVRITQAEIAQAHDRISPDPRVAVVPPIFHQIYHNWKQPGNNTLPPHWQEASQTCKDLNPTWEYKLWTTESSRLFLKEHFPWFLPTYDGYRFPIQRVDVLRYFLLRHYGGIYLDLDNGCAADLTPMTYYPAFTTDGDQGALSNNIIGGQPGHPYFHLLTETLVPWNWNWVLPYVVISFSSGQWFVTAMWERYHALLRADGTIRPYDGTHWRPLHRVLMDMRDGADPWVFFTQVRGGTWTNWDSAMFGWIGRHVLLVVLGIVALVAAALYGGLRLVRRVRRHKTRPRSRKGYDALPSAEQVP